MQVGRAKQHHVTQLLRCSSIKYRPIYSADIIFGFVANLLNRYFFTCLDAERAARWRERRRADQVVPVSSSRSVAFIVCCAKATTRIGDAESARHEIAGHENAAPCCWGGKCETWKCEKRDSMEHRVLHMSAHCRTGMHESTRKHQISPPTVGAPSAGLRLPWFCVCNSLTVMTWTIISWCWLSVTNVFLTFTQVVLSVVL